MPRITLEFEKPTLARQDALRNLNGYLPDFMHVMSDDGAVWVSYEDWFPEEKALDAVAKALDDSGSKELGIGIGIGQR